MTRLAFLSSSWLFAVCHWLKAAPHWLDRNGDATNTRLLCSRGVYVFFVRNGLWARVCCSPTNNVTAKHGRAQHSLLSCDHARETFKRLWLNLPRHAAYGHPRRSMQMAEMQTNLHKYRQTKLPPPPPSSVSLMVSPKTRRPPHQIITSPLTPPPQLHLPLLCTPRQSHPTV